MSQLLEIQQLVEDWATRTNKILRFQMKRLKVGDKGAGSNELFFSLKSKVYEKFGDKVQMDLSFLEHGRFRDMGAGSGSNTKIENMAGNLGIALKSTTKRKPAKWYSRPFYGRLNALMGVVSGNIQEAVVETIKELEYGPQKAVKSKVK